MPGKRYCRIVDIQTCVTTQVVATSTTPILNYGDGTTAAKFAAQNCGAVAATVAVGVTYNTRDADGRVAAYCSSGNTPYIDWDSAGNGGAALTTLVISVTDDGKGMRAEMLRRKAVEKGLIDLETANSLDDKQALQLIFLPGFSTKDQISNVSGRGVGMDVVRTNIQKLNGRIDINSEVGEGTRISISLPLTLAILPVLVVKVCNQPFAVPLAMVREIIPIQQDSIQEVSGRPTIVVRDEILPVRSLADLLGWQPTQEAQFGVLMQSAERAFILAIDAFVGRDDVVIKPLQNIRPRGVAGATLSGDGSVVLVLDMEDLLSDPSANQQNVTPALGNNAAMPRLTAA